MENIVLNSDLQEKLLKNDKSFLLLYKSGSEQSDCALQNFENATKNELSVPVYSVDVSNVRDIHTQYSISTVPTLLIFENNRFTNSVKGCQTSDYYRALINSALYVAKAKAEGKEPKRVTVYSTPSCSWCNTLKSWLRKNNIHFSDVDVSRDEKAAQDMVRKTGQQGVPQTDINGQTVVGFNQQRLKELLEI
jgi:glutaredoxin-like YruB-family protein